MVNESRIDFPVSDGLCPDVWVKKDSGRWSLKVSVRDRILDEVKKIERRLRVNVTDVRVIGSICTNLYGDTTDVDVHMSVTRKFDDADDAYAFNKRLWAMYDGNELLVRKHPIQFFVQHNFFQDLASVGVYSVKRDRWVYGPTIYPKTYNPFDVLKSALPAVERMSKQYSFVMSELTMALKNYVECCKASENGYSQKSVIERDKRVFASQIEDACKQLIDFGDAVKAKRRSASVGVSGFGEAKKFRESEKWHRVDAIAKFMDRYGYTKTCAKIKDIVGDKIRISPSTIYSLIELLGIAR